VVKQVIERIEAKIKCYKFYFEYLALDSSRDIEPGNKTRRYEVKALSSADLLKELGSKCWYCGTLLYRHKQHWKKVKYRLWNGKYEEGIELEKTTPYDGRPTHDNFVDFTVNSCRSCTSRRCRKPIENSGSGLGCALCQREMGCNLSKQQCKVVWLMGFRNAKLLRKQFSCSTRKPKPTCFI